MKTAMKKLLSFVLVAMLLVSAIPFQASATNGNSATIVLKINGTEVDTVTANFTKAPTTFQTLMDYQKVDLSAVAGCDFSHTWKAGMGSDTAGTEIQINNGDMIYVAYTQDAPTYSVNINVKLDGVEQGWYTAEINGESTTVSNLIQYKVDSALIDGYDFADAYVSGRGYIGNGTVNSGDSVYIAFTKSAPDPVAPINIVVKVESSDNVVWEGKKVPANGKSAVVEDLLHYCWNTDWNDVYEFDHAWSHEQQKNVAQTGKINAGDTVYIMVNKLASSGNNHGSNNNSNSNDSGSITNKFPYKVYLHIFKDNKVDEPAKTINITSGIALDGRVTLDEVKSLVKEYYTAKTSDGIGYDGLYLAEGNWVGNFVYDNNKYTTIEDTNTMRQTREVHINVMITNANAKTTTSTSTADSTNPKTGDSIYMVVSVMGLSVAALAAVYYVSKKRAF